MAADVPSVEDGEAFAASMTSYLGLLAHHDTYRLRRSLLRDEVDGWWSYASTGTGLRSVRVDPMPRPVRAY